MRKNVSLTVTEKTTNIVIKPEKSASIVKQFTAPDDPAYDVKLAATVMAYQNIYNGGTVDVQDSIVTKTEYFMTRDDFINVATKKEVKNG